MVAFLLLVLLAFPASAQEMEDLIVLRVLAKLHNLPVHADCGLWMSSQRWACDFVSDKSRGAQINFRLDIKGFWMNDTGDRMRFYTDEDYTNAVVILHIPDKGLNGIATKVGSSGGADDMTIQSAHIRQIHRAKRVEQ